MTNIPQYHQAKKRHIPAISSVPNIGKMKFGFKYFEQKDYFGLKNMKDSYFVGMFERLKHYSDITIEQFQTNSKIQNDNHIHTVNWQQKNIPLKKEDLSRIPQVGSDEFVLFTCKIFSGGRIAGFFDEENIFQIVLCDPKHNLQPSGGKFGYRVDQTDIEKSCFEYAHAHLCYIKDFKCDNEKCITYTIKEKYHFKNYANLYILSDEHVIKIDELKKQGLIDCSSEVFYWGIEYLYSTNSKDDTHETL